MVKGTILDERVLEDLGQTVQYPPNTPYSQKQVKKQVMSTPLDEKKYVRKAFSDVYRGLIMTKTNEWNQDPYGLYGIYKARLSSFTSSDNNIIIAIVPDDNNPLGTNKLIDSLDWVSIQTRQMKNVKKDLNGFNLPFQDYMIRNDSILHDRISLVQETPTKYIYSAKNLPLKVELLKLDENSQYSSEGTVWSALEVFSTVISLE